MFWLEKVLQALVRPRGKSGEIGILLFIFDLFALRP